MTTRLEIDGRALSRPLSFGSWRRFTAASSSRRRSRWACDGRAQVLRRRPKRIFSTRIEDCFSASAETSWRRRCASMSWVCSVSGRSRRSTVGSAPRCRSRAAGFRPGQARSSWRGPRPARGWAAWRGAASPSTAMRPADQRFSRMVWKCAQCDCGQSASSRMRTNNSRIAGNERAQTSGSIGEVAAPCRRAVQVSST